MQLTHLISQREEFIYKRFWHRDVSPSDRVDGSTASIQILKITGSAFMKRNVVNVRGQYVNHFEPLNSLSLLVFGL